MRRHNALSTSLNDSVVVAAGGVTWHRVATPQKEAGIPVTVRSVLGESVAGRDNEEASVTVVVRRVLGQSVVGRAVKVESIMIIVRRVPRESVARGADRIYAITESRDSAVLDGDSCSPIEIDSCMRVCACAGYGVPSAVEGYVIGAYYKAISQAGAEVRTQSCICRDHAAAPGWVRSEDLGRQEDKCRTQNGKEKQDSKRGLREPSIGQG